MTTNTATMIKELNGFAGHAALYELSPPATGDGEPCKYVVVSATNAMYSGPETHIFPADAEGNVTDWMEMEGSLKGTLSHEEALADAGYSIVVTA